MELIPSCNCIFPWTTNYSPNLLPLTPAQTQLICLCVNQDAKWANCLQCLKCTGHTDVLNTCSISAKCSGCILVDDDNTCMGVVKQQEPKCFEYSIILLLASKKQPVHSNDNS